PVPRPAASRWAAVSWARSSSSFAEQRSLRPRTHAQKSEGQLLRGVERRLFVDGAVLSAADILRFANPTLLSPTIQRSRRNAEALRLGGPRLSPLPRLLARLSVSAGHSQSPRTISGKKPRLRARKTTPEKSREMN